MPGPGTERPRGGEGMAGLTLTAEAASRFARITLGGVRREFPSKLDHVLGGLEDALGPRQLHPAFYGCFDWHSAVHGHWMLARLLRRFPELPEAGAIRGVLDEHLAPGPLAGELAYFVHPGHAGFERTYGWAWLLELAAELEPWEAAGAWKSALRPLALAVAEAFRAFLPRLSCPIRAGTHGNTAFSLDLALDYARVCGDQPLEDLVTERARSFYVRDGRGAVGAEPGGEDFLSPALEEAALMARILPERSFRKWFKGFLPDLGASGILAPALVPDRSDPRIVHLDGLNLSRARAFRVLAGALATHDPRRPALEAAARRHAQAALPHVASGHYVGEHWLGTFAVRMLGDETAAAPAPVGDSGAR